MPMVMNASLIYYRKQNYCLSKIRSQKHENRSYTQRSHLKYRINGFSLVFVDLITHLRSREGIWSVRTDMAFVLYLYVKV